MTLAAVLARSAGTLVPLDFAVGASKTWSTQAVVAPRALLWKINTDMRSQRATSAPVRVFAVMGDLWDLTGEWHLHPNLACRSVLALTVAAFDV